MASITLTDAQVTEVLAPSKRYPAEDYSAVLTVVRETGKAHGHIETLFPGVKPAHVVFMLKQLRGDAKDVTIDSHGAHGVCVIPVAKPAAKKPAAAKATAKPAAKKPTTRRKATTAAKK